jgi:hypothetical protein
MLSVLSKKCVAAGLASGCIAAQAQAFGSIELRAINCCSIEGNAAWQSCLRRTSATLPGVRQLQPSFGIDLQPCLQTHSCSSSAGDGTAGAPLQAYACGCRSYSCGHNWSTIGWLGVGGGLCLLQ